METNSSLFAVIVVLGVLVIGAYLANFLVGNFRSRQAMWREIRQINSTGNCADVCQSSVTDHAVHIDIDGVFYKFAILTVSASGCTFKRPFFSSAGTIFIDWSNVQRLDSVSIDDAVVPIGKNSVAARITLLNCDRRIVIAPWTDEMNRHVPESVGQISFS